MDDRVRVVVAGENKAIIEQIKSCLPDYLEVEYKGYADAHYSALHDRMGKEYAAGLIIIDGEDKSLRALELFRKLKSERTTNYIPVLVLVEDEFSDLAIGFLEYADCEFYEGEIHPDELFALSMRMIEDGEVALLFNDDDSVDSAIFEEKPADKVTGLTLGVTGESEESEKRCVVEAPDGQKDILMAALERGKRMQDDIRLNYEKAKEEKAVELELDRINRALNAIVGERSSANDLDDMASLERMVSRSKIVVVDDDLRSLNLANIFLNRKYEVVLINSGMKAIDYFVHYSADLILINYAMPVLNGIKILESIRWQPKGRMVPAIIMTDKNKDYVLGSCKNLHVLSVIDKPLTRASVSKYIESVLK